MEPQKDLTAQDTVPQGGRPLQSSSETLARTNHENTVPRPLVNAPASAHDQASSSLLHLDQQEAVNDKASKETRTLAEANSIPVDRAPHVTKRSGTANASAVVSHPGQENQDKLPDGSSKKALDVTSFAFNLHDGNALDVLQHILNNAANIQITVNCSHSTVAAQRPDVTLSSKTPPGSLGQNHLEKTAQESQSSSLQASVHSSNDLRSSAVPGALDLCQSSASPPQSQPMSQAIRESREDTPADSDSDHPRTQKKPRKKLQEEFRNEQAGLTPEQKALAPPFVREAVTKRRDLVLHIAVPDAPGVDIERAPEGCSDAEIEQKKIFRYPTISKPNETAPYDRAGVWVEKRFKHAVDSFDEESLERLNDWRREGCSKARISRPKALETGGRKKNMAAARARRDAAKSRDGQAGNGQEEDASRIS